MVDALAPDEARGRVDALLRCGGPVRHSVVNASGIALAQNDERLREIIDARPIVDATTSMSPAITTALWAPPTTRRA